MTTATIDQQSETGAAPADLQKVTALIEQRGAFDFLSLSLITSPEAVPAILKAQHGEILALTDDVRRAADDRANKPGAVALEVRNLLTVLASRLTVHLAFESNQVFKLMAADARLRALGGQFERESGNLKASFQAFTNTYGTPSAILGKLSDFKQDLEALRREFSDAFKAEERELYPSYERASRTI